MAIELGLEGEFCLESSTAKANATPIFRRSSRPCAESVVIDGLSWLEYQAPNGVEHVHKAHHSRKIESIPGLEFFWFFYIFFCMDMSWSRVGQQSSVACLEPTVGRLLEFSAIRRWQCYKTGCLQKLIPAPRSLQSFTSAVFSFGIFWALDSQCIHDTYVYRASLDVPAGV